MHLAPIIRDLGVTLAIAGMVTLIFKKIRQPVVLGYLVAGMIVGPKTPPFALVGDLPNIKTWSELGIIFLMFSIGLEFTFHKLRRVGNSASITALFETSTMLALGFVTGQCLGWTRTESLFLGGMIAISSTTMIVKALDALGLRTRRFAEIVLGVVVVEDLVAVLLLVGLSTFALSQNSLGTELVLALVRLVSVVSVWFLVGYFLVPTFFRYAGKYADDETLTILSTGLCLMLAIIATELNYSSALGAFIMGSLLAETTVAPRLERLITPLKNLFAAVFFVSVGMLIEPETIWQYRGTILAICLVTVFGKIATCTLGALLTGQGTKRSLQIGLSLAQNGEFSFIIAGLGISLGATRHFLYPIAIAVAVFTSFSTPYLIRDSARIATWVENHLPHRLREWLDQYAHWVETLNDRERDKKKLLTGGFRFVLNALLVTMIFLAVSQGLQQTRVGAMFAQLGESKDLVLWTMAVLLSAPFIWGMFSAFRSPTQDQQLAHFLGAFLTVLWTSVLSQSFFSSLLAFAMTVVGASLLFLFFFGRLESSYRWFETGLLANLSASSKSSAEGHLRSVLPRDLYLAKLAIGADAKMAGVTLAEAKIREQYGPNILMIRRGERMIASPRAQDRLLPGDEVLVLGTDDQVDQFRIALLDRADTSRDLKDLSDYSLKRITISKESGLLDQTIRESGIRENLKGAVAALEREGTRTINPDPNTRLCFGDVLWVVGGLES